MVPNITVTDLNVRIRVDANTGRFRFQANTIASTNRFRFTSVRNVGPYLTYVMVLR